MARSSECQCDSRFTCGFCLRNAKPYFFTPSAAAAATQPQSGYCSCACRDCFEIAITSDGKPAFCHACQDAGCPGYQGQPGMSQECQVEVSAEDSLDEEEADEENTQ